MAPVLGYWSARGLVQPIRFMLEYAGAKYEEKQYNGGPAPDFSRAEWTSVKDTIGLDFPNLPYYIDGDLKITESGAITRHLARKYGLDGATEEEKIKIDMAIGIMADLGRPQAMLFYSPDFETAKVPFIAEINTPLQKVSKLLGANNYIAGDKISFADFALFELLERYELLVPTCLSGFANLQAFKKRFTELPAIKKYMASPAFLKLKDRFNGRRAQIGTGTY